MTRKERLLSKISPLDIFRAFFRPDLQLNRPYCSPLRRDENPSFVVFIPTRNRRGQDLLYKDHGTGEVGDCFDFVMRLYNCSFSEALDIIEQAFLAGKVIRQTTLLHPQSPLYNKLQPQLTHWTKELLDYWKSYHITQKTLSWYNTYPAKKLRVNKTVIVSTPQDPIYLYVFYDAGKNSKIGYKAYRPLATEGSRFLRDYSPHVTEGLWQCVNRKFSQLCLITKSMKDVMVLHEMGVNAVASPSETTFINTQHLSLLQKHFRHLILLYDNDPTGIESAQKLSQKHQISHIILPNAKDISDLAQKESIKVAKETLKELVYQLLRHHE